MADSKNTSKSPHFKGQSRVQKICHWCTKPQESGKPSFQACSRCKEVIYCSKDCQVKSWPFHKGSCKSTADLKKVLENAPLSLTQEIVTFKKWHGSHTALLRHCVLCALQLDKHPEDADKKIIGMTVQLVPNHADLPPDRKYRAIDGFVATREEVEEMLNPSGGKSILQATWATHEYMKSNGNLGVAPVILRTGHVVDVVNVPLTSQAITKKAFAVRGINWGDDWVNGFNDALDLYHVTGEPLFV